MKFIYDKIVDDECHQRLAACGDIFGEEKRIDIYPVTPEVIKYFINTWTPEVESHFDEGMRKIFNSPVPDDFTCYINSTPYSMDTLNGISISASITQTPVRMICHETNHFMFRRSKFKDELFPNIDIEDAKEIFVVLNNIYFQDIMENQDIGWKKFWKVRYKFLIEWIKKNDSFIDIK